MSENNRFIYEFYRIDPIKNTLKQNSIGNICLNGPIPSDDYNTYFVSGKSIVGNCGGLIDEIKDGVGANGKVYCEPQTEQNGAQIEIKINDEIPVGLVTPKLKDAIEKNGGTVQDSNVPDTGCGDKLAPPPPPPKNWCNPRPCGGGKAGAAYFNRDGCLCHDYSPGTTKDAYCRPKPGNAFSEGNTSDGYYCYDCQKHLKLEQEINDCLSQRSGDERCLGCGYAWAKHDRPESDPDKSGHDALSTCNLARMTLLENSICPKSF